MIYRRGIVSVVAAGIVIAPLNGCVTPTLAQYDQPSDTCNIYRQPLLETEKSFNQNVAGGVLLGALAGAAIGLASGHGGRGVAIGAAAGALAGGTAGYLKAKQDQAMSQAALLAEIDSDAMADAGYFRTTSGTIGNLTNCRSSQITAITDDFKRGAIARDEAERRLNAVQQSIALDKELLGKVLSGTGRRADMYIDARAEATGLPREQVIGKVADLKPTDLIRQDTVPAGAKSYVSTASANVRGAPSTSAHVVAGLKTGETVRVVSEAGGGWYKVDLDGVGGYVHNSLLAEAGSPTAEAAIAKAARASTQRPAAAPVQTAAAPSAPVSVAAAESVVTVEDNVQRAALLNKEVEAQAAAYDRTTAQQMQLALLSLGGPAPEAAPAS